MVVILYVMEAYFDLFLDQKDLKAGHSLLSQQIILNSVHVNIQYSHTS